MTVPPAEEAARRVRLRGQLLDASPSAPRDAAHVAAALVGVQAQDLVAAALSVRARSEGLVIGDVERAATDPESHPLVLTWTLRGTRHLHQAADVRWLLDLVGSRFARPGARQEQLGIAGAAGDRAVRVLTDALAEGAMPTRREVGLLLAGHGVDPSGRAPIHVIRRAALEGVLCIIPGPQGDQRRERYVALDRWAPPVPPDHGGLEELVRRYLAAYGPATPADFSAWSGLAAKAVAIAWRGAVDDGELAEVRLPSGSTWMLAQQLPATLPAVPELAPTRMLGAFDTLLLGYADRSLHLDPDQGRAVNAGGGMIKPVVVADGRVVATWRLRRARKETLFEVSRLPGTGGGTHLAAEFADIKRFLGLTRS